jgi:competence protein ComEA
MPLRRFTMPSNWINAENVPTCGQELGAIGLFGLLLSGWLIAALLPAIMDCRQPAGLSYAERTAGTKAVELSGQPETDGIYIVPESATIRDIFRMVGLEAEGPSAGEVDQRPPNGVHIRFSGPGDSFRQFGISDMAAGTKLLFDVPLDINRARAEELMLLNGIGPKTAEAIVAYRSRHGAFRSIDDLKAIKGLKDKKLEKVRKTIEVRHR